MQMEQDTTFIYRYSAKENKEISEIRKKYLPQNENKFEELKRLDKIVQTAGKTEALSLGIGGTMMLGLGMCLAMQIIGNGMAMMAIGVILGLIGMMGIAAAYPLYRKIFKKTKEKYAPEILMLAEELSRGKSVQ